MKLCTIHGCERPFLARGWCATHYQRWRISGDPGGAELLRSPGDPEAVEKRCTICRETKPMDAFYAEPRNRDRRMSHCKQCFGDRQKPGRRLRKYGIDADEYEALLVAQRHRCAICREARKLVIDHCHRSTKVRALLCDRCNRLLGVVDDDAKLLMSAVRFLRRHKEAS